MRDILILGKGRLGKYLYKIGKLYNLKIEIQSIRELCSISDLSWEYQSIVDGMDTAGYQASNFVQTNQKIHHIRTIAAEKALGRYNYISSTRVYQQSENLIDEFSPLISQEQAKADKYIENKLFWERWLLNRLGSRVTIFRPVALWDFFPNPSNKSFFDDLIYSRLTGNRLKSQNGDEQVVSYMNYMHAASIILKILMKSDHIERVYNISSEIWSTREALKANKKINVTSCSGTGLKIKSQFAVGSSLFSQLSSLL